MPVPPFDQLHVISDIHLGGLPGFQIFNQGPALAWTIDQLAAETDERVALVLNGDIVDFLAETRYQYFDPLGASSKLQRIFDDPAFKPVWDALARFTEKPNLQLILVLGNHDVELALPEIQESLRQRLCANDAARRGRLTLAMEGNGYACQVGNRDVLCVHGNEIDSWNVVDFFALNKTIRALNRKAELPDWKPNAGTMMVIDVMNDIKQKYQWVDLLKPETAPVPTLLVALDNSVANKLTKLPSIALTRTVDKTRMSMGFLSVEEGGAEPDQAKAQKNVGQFLSASFDLDTDSAPSGRRSVNQSLAYIEAQLERNRDPKDLADETPEGEFLGFFDTVISKLTGRGVQENVQKALQNWLSKDTTWDPFSPDETFYEIDKMTGPGIDFVIAGHTHLHRALKRQKSQGFYFNSGTWIRLIKLTEKMLYDDKTFAKLWTVLGHGSMTALDDPAKVGVTGLKVVEHIRTLVSIRKEARGVVGSLNQVVDEPGGGFRIELVPKSECVS